MALTFYGGALASKRLANMAFACILCAVELIVLHEAVGATISCLYLIFRLAIETC